MSEDVARIFKLFVDPGLENLYHLLVLELVTPHAPKSYSTSLPEIVLEFAGHDLSLFASNLPTNRNHWSLQETWETLFHWAISILRNIEEQYSFHPQKDRLKLYFESQHKMKLSLVAPVLSTVAKMRYENSVSVTIVSPMSLLAFCRRALPTTTHEVLKAELLKEKRTWRRNKFLAITLSNHFLLLVIKKSHAVLNMEMLQEKMSNKIESLMLEKIVTLSEIHKKMLSCDPTLLNIELMDSGDWMIAQNLGTVVNMWAYYTDVANYIEPTTTD